MMLSKLKALTGLQVVFNKPLLLAFVIQRGFLAMNWTLRA